MTCSNKKCTDGIEIVGCCSSRDCGCMGFPVAAKNCEECNKENRPPTDKRVLELLNYVEWLGD
ncbi:TPA: hypothetical protein SLE56_001109 [Morganella morganii]|nr:hypothetical protein [Morganella morganii]